VDVARAEPAARNAAFGIANVKTTTDIVSELHERRRVLSGLPVKSMFGTAGQVRNCRKRNMLKCGNRTPE